MAPATDLKISRVLHAGYIFEFGKTRIIFDPIFENPFSGNCHAFPSVRFDSEQIRGLSFAAIFISHYHDDHCSFESLDLIDRATPIYIHCVHEEMFTLIRELGFKAVHQLKFGESVTIGDFAVKPWRPIDDDIDSILQIKVAGLNILNVVDSVIDPSSLELLKSEGPWDLVLWPFQTMRETAVLTPSRGQPEDAEIPTEWIDELRALNPRYVVPSACQFLQEPWSWYNKALFPITYRKFADEIRAALPPINVVRMNPGTSFILDHTTLRKVAPLEWVIPVGDQDLDFKYDPTAIPTATSEIAKRFIPLNENEKSRTLAFCKSELMKRYKALEPTPFFENVKIWRLSIFDHHGVALKIHYKIKNHSIELTDQPTSSISWSTEVPLAKLFAAFELGETLTSMYLRIFAEGTEIDVLEDPLIRTLFHGRFGDYQRDQLRRIPHN